MQRLPDAAAQLPDRNRRHFKQTTHHGELTGAGEAIGFNVAAGDGSITGLPCGTGRGDSRVGSVSVGPKGCEIAPLPGRCKSAFAVTGFALCGWQYASGAVPFKKYSGRPPYPGGARRSPHTRTFCTSGGTGPNACAAVPFNADFMKRDQILAGTLPP